MIKANHLRIGNKLQKSNGEIFTVLRLDNTDDVLVEEQRGLLTLNYNLYGIPLTPELLEKCGFEILKNEMQHLGIECKLIINGSGRDATWFSSCASHDGFQRVLCLCKGNYFANNIQYLHQLQNLYFALTNEELKITL